MEAMSLNGRERLVLRVPVLQRFVVNAHTRALAATLDDASAIRSVAIVGGGLFPRSALVLRRVCPDARVVIIDADRCHLDAARHFLQTHPPTGTSSPEFRHATFVAGDDCAEFDLVIVPLAFKGDRARLYDHPPAPRVLIHDWCWRPRGRGRLVSLALLKRVNLVGDRPAARLEELRAPGTMPAT
jgi:hypothetical protein